MQTALTECAVTEGTNRKEWKTEESLCLLESNQESSQDGNMQGRLLMLLVFSICFTRGSFKSCPKIPVQKNFTLSEFMGTWFEIEALNSRLIKGDCVTHTFHQSTDNWIQVNTTEKRKDNKRILYIGKLSPANVNQAAKLQILLSEGVYLDFVPVQDEFSFIPYNVLATDFRKKLPDNVLDIFSWQSSYEPP
ncbi:hypothetical protein scyTo_0000864 [Scyliorhinus torazame]|uniref:Lipocalin/cytosolic fatty-acid binding domain-containing protein n=1 Tax=Scyliorhinus torazame TaxID=75743 RepID=A0A401P5F0_SCYTO|nr:hypothetical protein [Scyliorhinus torazame]